MRTFNNDSNLKEELIAKLKHHQELDTFIQGQWLDTESGKVEGNGFKGCFYGCTMQTSENPLQKFSEKYSIERWFTDITEKIFEGLPSNEANMFPLQCIEALPVGVDLNIIKSKWNIVVLTDQLRFVYVNSEQEKAIKQCISLFEVPFNEITRSAAESAARSAESAAWSARSAAESAESAESAAWSARSAAWSAAWSARSAAWSAESAAWSARSAAWSAAESAAESASRSAHYVWLRDQFINLLKSIEQ